RVDTTGLCGGVDDAGGMSKRIHPPTVCAAEMATLSRSRRTRSNIYPVRDPAPGSSLIVPYRGAGSPAVLSLLRPASRTGGERHCVRHLSNRRAFVFYRLRM